MKMNVLREQPNAVTSVLTPTAASVVLVLSFTILLQMARHARILMSASEERILAAMVVSMDLVDTSVLVLQGTF